MTDQTATPSPEAAPTQSATPETPAQQTQQSTAATPNPPEHTPSPIEQAKQAQQAAQEAPQAQPAQPSAQPQQPPVQPGQPPVQPGQPPVTEQQAQPGQTPPNATAPEEAGPPGEPDPTEAGPLKPEDYNVPDFITPQMRQFAADNGFTQEQFDKTIGQFAGMLKQHGMQEKIMLEKQGQEQIKQWGEAADHNLSLARRALKQNDPDGHITKLLNESGYGNSPVVLQFLHRLGKSMQEGGYLKGNLNVPPGKKTAAQAMYGETHPTTGI